ncbi:hypothetical protein CEXT_250621 [Caerostris extrusa]|uniref:Uncharacterized protein n=1 Tax=Caerostris extrusa TaxID=172846 RepID=A0AAV4N562_CAEEX|nr:hypothetical protein CEXT_250621 [Caerostris extrusa]
MCGKRKKTHQSAKCCKRKKNYNQSVEKNMSKKSNNNSTKCNKRKKSDQSVNRNKRKKIDDQLVSKLSANGSKVNVFPRINMSASKKSIKECIKTESCNINSSSSKDYTSDVGKTSLSSNLPEPCVAVTNQNLTLKERICKQHAEEILTRVLGYTLENDSNSPFQCFFCCPQKPMKTHSKSDIKSDDHLAKNQEHSQTINDKFEFERHIPNNQSNPTDADSNFDSNCLRNSNNLQLVPKNSDRRKRTKNKHHLAKNQEHIQTINDKLEFERHIPNNQSNPTDADSNFDSNCLRNSNNLQLVPKNSDRRKRTKNKHHLAKNQEHSQTINDKLEFERHIPNNQSNPTDADSNFDSNCLRNSNNLQLVPKNSDRRKRTKNKHHLAKTKSTVKPLMTNLSLKNTTINR